MYKRDVGILLLSLFAVYFSIQNEGPFSFRKAWVLHLEEGGDDFSLPPPVVADLNGDGKMEVLVATHDSRLKLIMPRAAGHAGEGFAAAGHLAEVSLLPNGWPESLMSAKRAVAVKTGFLDKRPVESVRALRKQVVVVVLADWTVVCLDHNLQTLWYTQIREEAGGPYGWATMHAKVREVGILISNHTMRQGDRGVVIVGGSVELGDLKDDDVLEAELLHDRESHESQQTDHRRPTPISEDKWRVNGIDVSKHFSYYALEGETGQERWKHEGQDFHRNAGELADVLLPQHNYRLDAKSAEGRHYGEVACKEFWESVLRVMPHSWERLSDTELKLAHFKRYREDRGQKKADLAVKEHRRRSGQPMGQHGPPPRHGLDHRNPVAKLLGKAAARAGRDGSAARLAHGEGKALPPNVVLAHLEEGIEAVHLYSGRTLCKLHLAPGGLHTDLNADGVLDHIQVMGENQMGEGLSDTGHRHLHGCSATATSGTPPRHAFFNTSVCRHGHTLGGIVSYLESGHAPLEVALPAVLPRPLGSGRYRRGAGNAVFLNSHGEMTAVDPTGHQIWQHDFGIHWDNWGSGGGGQAGRRVATTLQAMPLCWGGIPTLVLASGAFEGVAVSEHGHLIDRFGFPAAPRLPLQMADFNGDGLTDILLVAHGGVFGYAQVRRPGGVPFSALLALLIVAMAFVYMTHQAGPSKPAGAARSTDRVD